MRTLRLSQRPATLVTIALIALAGCNRGASPASNRPPNLIIILADDLGYGDLGAYGSTVHRTPNLDRMADQGVLFTTFYVTGCVCTPSRASLMTGCYPRRVGLDENENGQGVLFPGNRRGLNPDEVTIAEILRQRGYATGIIGKWHLGDQPEFLPTRHGFDFYFGVPYSNDMGREGFEWRVAMSGAPPPDDAFYVPLPVLRNDAVVETEPDQGLLTRRYTEEAIAFIERNRQGPFFLYLAHTMPHQPVHASPAFLGSSKDGVYGDAVEEIDWSTGRLMNTLRELGLADRTLVIFTSDNGANVFGGSNEPLRGFKATTWEGGMRVPCLVWWPGEVPAGNRCDEVATIMDLLPTFTHLAGGELPRDRVIDGHDIWPLMSGQPGARSPYTRLYYYRQGTLEGVRDASWKLRFGDPSATPYLHLVVDATRATANLSTEGSRLLAFLSEHYPEAHDRLMKLARESAAEPDSRVALFDLVSDISERVDLADREPETVGMLLRAADEARSKLGDSDPDHPGVALREPGFVADAKPLVAMVHPAATGSPDTATPP